MKQISGTDAIAMMREMRHDNNRHFELHHLTYNAATDDTKGLRVVQRCRLRPSLPNEAFAAPADVYLPYMDLDLNEPRVCYKKLVRAVAFPPHYELMRVNWFINQ